MARSQSKTPPQQRDLVGDLFGQAGDFGAHLNFLGRWTSYIERAVHREKGLARKWSAGALAGGFSSVLQRCRRGRRRSIAAPQPATFDV
jgi:hypothetical protein